MQKIMLFKMGAGTRQSSCIAISFVLWVYEQFVKQNSSRQLHVQRWQKKQ